MIYQQQMLLKHWFAHASTIAIVVPCLSASLRGNKYYDLSILPGKLFLHATFLLSIVKQIELLVLQCGQLLQDERPQLLLVQLHDLMMLVWEGLYKPLPYHNVNVNSPHNLLFYIHETKNMLDHLDTPTIPKHTILLRGGTIPYIPFGYGLESCAFGWG